MSLVPGHGLARRPRRVHVGLLLGLAHVLLVADPLVAEPVADLRHGDAALPGQLLLHLGEMEAGLRTSSSSLVGDHNKFLGVNAFRKL